MRMFGKILVLALGLVPGAALAQGANFVAIEGIVESIDATSLTLKAAGGASETYRLAPNIVVLQNRPASLTDIQPNDYVASAAMRGMDGKLHSTEVRIFPEAMRGIGEGQRAMNDPRNQTMTNATVTGTAVMNGSNNLKVRLPGGESELVVDPGVPITRIVAIDRAALVKGAGIRAQGARADGAVVVSRITLQ